MILRFSSLVFLTTACPLLEVTAGFGLPVSFGVFNTRKILQKPTTTPLQMSDDFSNFAYMDDDDDLLFDKELDRKDYAKEEDSQEFKAEIGGSLEAPEIDPEHDVEPIFVPQGTQLELTEDNVLALLSACREEIGTLFGYSAENRGVGITGGVDFVELDGPIVMLRLKGRFWHQRPTVLARVGAYLIGRIPEIIDVVIEDEYQLTDEANEAAL
mmetsp:Transcript_28885/g.40595  ORF Transcript_28885/g.40595 Transcript_28885/m.40595 type:complete len:213 (+) Transcript_28885:136-774(+)